MYRSEDVNRGNYVGKVALLAMMAIAGLCLGATQLALGQVPGAVFSYANGIGGIDGTVSHIAANSRGDVFVGSVNGSLASIEEYPAGSTTAVTLVSHMFNNGYGNGNVGIAVDSANNVYAADPGDGSIVYVPFVNGSYPTGAAYTSLSQCGNGNFPLATQGITTACKGFGLPGALGYYLQFIDVAFDGSGNLYTLSQYTGGSGATYANGQNMIVEWLANSPGNYTLVADNLPSNGGAEIAVDKAGDVYYVDSTSRSTIQYMAAGVTSVTAGTTTNNSLPATLGSGLNHPTGVSVDASGNVYITDQVAISGSTSNRIVEIPSINGTVSAANQYTLSNEISSGNSNLTNTSNNEYGPSTGVGIDGYGNIFYAGAYPNSLNEAIIGKAAFGAQAVNTTSGSQTLNVSFTSGATFGSLTIMGPFSYVSSNCINGQTFTKDSVCTITLSFKPTTVGPQSGALLVSDISNNVLGSAALSGSGTAALLNVDPGTESAIGTTWTAPNSIAIDASGKTYVVDSGNVYMTAAGGGTPSAVVTGLNSPTAVAIDGGLNLYVAQTGSSTNEVVEIPYGDSAYGTPVVLVKGLSGPSGLALDAQGNLYVADSGNGRVLLLSNSGDQGIGSLISTVNGTFTTPVAVAVDNLGNLYVSDAGSKKVVQIALATSTQTTILSGMTTPAGVAVDGAGSLFAADSGAGTITRIPNISSALNTAAKSNIAAALATAIAHPNGIAFDSNGILYVADATDASVTEVDRSAGVINFGSVDENTTSPQMTAAVSNGGTAAVTLSTPYFTASGADTADFAEGSSTCSAGGVGPTGSTCTVAAKFTPGALGALSASWTLQSNALNSPVITLKGTGVVNLTSTTLGLAVTSPVGAPVYGQSVTVTATVTPGTGPTGNVTFFVDSIQQTPNVSLTAGAASITLNGLAGGAHTVSATYNGDSTYAASNQSLPVTVNPAPTATSVVSITSSTPLGSNPISATTGASLTFTATVTPSVAGSLLGTVTFKNGAASLATAVVVTQNGNGVGTATFTTSALTAGSYNVTATYVGDADNATSVSASAVALQINPPLPYAGPGAVFSLANGLSSVDGYGSTVGHIAANSRGDVFIGTGASIEEYPAGTSNSVTLVSGLGGNGSGGIAVDAAGNVYAADPGDEKIIFVPFVHGSYPTGATFASLSQCGSGNLPFASPTQTTACSGFGGLPGAFGYYIQFIDVGVDGQGNLYTLSKYTGGNTSSTGYANGQNMILEWPVTGNYTLLADNLPSNGGAEIAVDKTGDVYYVDTTSRSTIQYLAAGQTAVTAGTTTNNSLPATLGTGFTQPTGVSVDASGNLYITDQANKSLAEIPIINGIISTTNQYTLSGALSTYQTSGPQNGVAVDGYGRVTFAGNYPNSLNYAIFGRTSFGATPVNTTSGAQTLNVEFPTAVTFGSFTITGPFAQSATTCAAQAYLANGSCTVSVTYSPTAAGPQSGVLIALDNSGDVLGTAELSGTGQAAVLDVDPGTVAAIGTTWTAPSAIAVDAAGNTYVADAGKIYKSAAGGGTPAAVVSGLNAPTAVAVDVAGNLYVAETGNSSNQVVEIPYANSAYGTPNVLVTGLSGASGLALDAQGNLYVADSGKSRVLLLSRSGDLPLGSLISTVSGTFTAPVALAVDNLGNLYVSDSGKVVQIVLGTSAQTTILSGLTTAAGVGVDAGGSLYAADAGAGTITRVPNVGGTINTSLNPGVALATTVAKPNAIAVDGNGNVYAADSADAVVSELNRNAGTLSLGNINVLASSAAIAAEVTDGGTAALTFGTPVITASGADPGDFAFQNSSTCTASGSINPAVGCTVAAIFTPQAQGARSALWSLQSNAQDSASLTVQGTGASLAVTSLSLAVTAPVGTPTYGQSVTVTASLTPGTGPTGNVTFYVDGAAQTPNVALASGQASITLNGLAGGAHTIAATYNGDAAFASSNHSLQITINPAATATSVVTLSGVPPLGSNPTSATLGTAVTMSATVTPAIPGTLTGTVTFKNGNTVLQSGATVTQTGGGAGTASFTTSTLTAGTYSITATYTGDTDFAASVSASAASLVINAPPPNTTFAVFTNAGYVSSVNSAPGLTSTPDYQASAGHLAANSRGDVFFVDAPYAFPNTAYLIEIPANGGSQITLLSGLGYGSNAVYADSGNNLWVADENSNIVYIPFVNGAYASGTVVNASLGTCTAPISTNTAPCKYYWQLTNAVGDYVQPSDVALDGSGNVYVVDKYDGTTNGGKNRILEFSAVDGTMTLLVDGLPSVGGAQLAVDPSGDVYYADGNGVYYFVASSFPITTGSTTATAVGTGLSDPTGVSLDSGGNLYISDQGNNRIVEIPNENGTIKNANQFTLTGSTNISSNHAQNGVGVDGFGKIYYVGNYGNSINYLTVGRQSFGSTAIGTATSASTLALYFTAPATFGSFALSGGDGAFAIGTNGCTQGKTYAAGAFCTVSITYTATAAGVQSGAITALDNNSNLLGQATLSGSGQAPLLNVDPATVSAIGTTWVAPSAITVDAAGNTYVADAGKIYKTTPGGSPSAVASGFSNPSAVAIDGAGDLYVGDSGNKQIVEVPYVNSLYGTPIVLTTGLKGVSGLALDGLGDLYIADSGNARVLRLSRTGNLQAQSLLTTVGSGFTSPVAVAIDNSGNLYVSDAGSNKIVQVAIPTSQQTTILTGLTTAAGVAVDAGGSLYVNDSGAGLIYRIPSINGVLNKTFQSTLGSVVAKPNAIALDSAGNVYAADATDGRVAEGNRSAGVINFGNVNALATSASIAANITDGGTTALTLNSPYYTASGTGAASFALQNSSSCAAGSVNPGANCTVAATFTPQTSGVQSETLTFSANALNSSSLVFTGVGTNLPVSTLVIAVISPTGPPAYGQAVTIGATVTPNAASTGAPTGTVTFYLNNVPQTPIETLTNNTASYTFNNLPGGVSKITAIYSGDSKNSSSTSNTLSFTINAASTATSVVSIAASPLWTNPLSINVGEAVTFSAGVSAPGATGTITFMNGNTVLGSGGVNAAGQASFTTSSLTAGSYNITAVYSGDSNFTGSSSPSAVSLLVSGPTITMTSSSLDITGGGAPVTLTFNSIAGFGLGTGPNTVGLACSGLPKYASCSFTPGFVQFITNNNVAYPTQQVSLAVVINQPPPITPSPAGFAGIPHMPGRPVLETLLGLSLLIPGAILGFRLRGARLACGAVGRWTAVLLLLLGIGMMGINGCGSSGTAFSTPVGTSTFTVTATISSANQVPNPPPTQTLQFTLTVNK